MSETHLLCRSHVRLLWWRNFVVEMVNQLFAVIRVVNVISTRFSLPALLSHRTVRRLDVWFWYGVLKENKRNVRKSFGRTIQLKALNLIRCIGSSMRRKVIVVLVAALAGVRRIPFRVALGLQIALREIMPCRRGHRQPP